LALKPFDFSTLGLPGKKWIIFWKISRQIVIGDKHQEIEAMVQQAIDSGETLDNIINLALIEAMDAVGRRFGTGEIFVPEMQKVIETLQAKGIREQIRVMVGGAPVSAQFAQDIGADAFGKIAAEAVSVVRRFIGQR
jgi:methanogenic corrinoid protein MtbC1